MTCPPDVRRRRLSAFLCLAAGLGRAAQAQEMALDFPARPIRWIVPYTTGATADLVARVLGAQVTIDVGQPVAIENKAGGNTALAATEAARAPADGYTVLSADSTTLVFNPALYRTLGYSPSRDFAPVALLARLPMVLLVGPSSGVRDARAFVEDARAFPGRFHFASAGNGSPQHLAMALLAQEARLEMVHVPYRGIAQALVDVAGGQVPVAMGELTVARRFIEGGRLRPLAVASALRLASLPGVPTFAELGLPRVEASNFLGLVAPAGTPPEVVARLQRVASNAVHNPVVQRRFTEYAIEPMDGTAAEFAALLARESARWHPLIRALNLALD